MVNIVLKMDVEVPESEVKVPDEGLNEIPPAPVPMVLSSNFATVTAPSAILAVVTLASRIFAVVTAPSAILAVVMLALTILTVSTESEASLAAVTAVSAIFAVVIVASANFSDAVIPEFCILSSFNLVEFKKVSISVKNASKSSANKMSHLYNF